MVKKSLRTYSSLWSTITRIWIASSLEWRVIHSRRNMWSQLCTTCSVPLAFCIRLMWYTGTSNHQIYYLQISAMLFSVTLVLQGHCRLPRSNWRSVNSQRYSMFPSRAHHPQLNLLCPPLNDWRSIRTLIMKEAVSAKKDCLNKNYSRDILVYKKNYQFNQQTPINWLCQPSQVMHLVS